MINPGVRQQTAHQFHFRVKKIFLGYRLIDGRTYWLYSEVCKQLTFFSSSSFVSDSAGYCFITCDSPSQAASQVNSACWACQPTQSLAQDAHLKFSTTLYAKKNISTTPICFFP